MSVSPFQSTSTDGQVLVGASPLVAQLRAEIRTAARSSDAKVLITGETGVGKEVVARLVHEGSARHHQPFVTINCAALPDSLLESELFGHVRGSFTDAHRDKPGLAALADHGTLFLDEIGETSARMQAVLLRFSETHEIQRVGSERTPARVDTRIISATNRHLSECIAAGTFRQDLFYRLNVIQINVPPLRERGSDTLLLFTHFLAHYARLHHIQTPAVSPATHDLLLAYRWPGNVRELKNVVERIVVRHGHGPVGPEALPPEIRHTSDLVSGPTVAGSLPEGDSVRHPAAEAAWNEMVIHGKSFWTVVQPLFIERELTKTDLRHIIKRGLENTQGSYRKLTDLFNISSSDYKRFLAFLYQHDCHLAFLPFREGHGTIEPGVARAVR